jgi:deferrochelatase/peroxidase EfeB
MAQQKPHDVNEPSRRRLLKGIGALGGALAITGGCPVAHAAKAESSPGRCHPTRARKTAILWPHQAGILTPQQASMMLVAFDVLAR